MLSMDIFNTSVSLYNGQVSFPLPLLDVPGRNGLDLTIALAYNSNVLTQATTWNLMAPTGMLGLGWMLPIDRILATSGESAIPGGRQFYFAGAGTSGELVATGTTDDGSISFALTGYAFWKILYDPSRERWEITRENGDTFIYGDSTSGRDTVQWGVAWEAWRGSSNRTQNQRRVPVAWNLSEITNRFGDRITYAYTNVIMPTGGTDGIGYTQASYPARITAVGGEQVIFTYGDKQSVEYQDPHTAPPPPNPYQDRFETKYLASIAVISAENAPLGTYNFIYGPRPDSPTFLGNGQLSKRLLLEIQRIYPEGGSLPNPTFSYYDSTGNGALYGALRTATLPTGGTITYAYQQATPQFSSRDIAVAPPTETGTTFTLPRFHFEQDYVVATWLATTGAANGMKVMAYTWDGRWIAKDLGTIPLPNAATYQTTPVSTAHGLFAVYVSQQMRLYHRDVARAGEWVQPSGANPYFSPPIPPTNGTRLAIGHNYAALLDTTAGVLYRYTWNGIAWLDAATYQLDAAGPNAQYGISASGNVISAVAVASDQPGGATPWVYLIHSDIVGAWSSTFRTVDPVPGPVSGIDLFAGETFTVFRSRSVRGTSAQITYGVFWWDGTFDMVRSQTWYTTSIPASSAPDDPDIRGSMVAIGQKTWRFDGTTWLYKDIATITYPLQQGVEFISVGADQMLRRIRTGNTTTPYTFDLVVYDPATGGWTVPAGMSGMKETALFASVASNRRNQASNYVIFESAVYYRNPDGSWTQGGALPGAADANDIASFQLAPGYLAYQTGSGTQGAATVVSFLRNGTIVQPPQSITLAGEQIYIPGAPASALVGEKAFVTYTGTYATGPTTLRLYSAVQEKVQGAQTRYVASVVTVDTGYPETDGVNGPISTAYAFENNAATIDPTGEMPQFNSGSRLSGTATAASAPNGTTTSYYFNGLSGTAPETPLLPYPTGADFTNAPTEYSLAKGAAYTSNQLDTSGETVQSTVYYWWITTLQLGTLGMGGYARLRRTSSVESGVTTNTDSAFSTDTGLPTSSRGYNYQLDGTELVLQEDYIYFWQKYDPTRALNLLTPVVEIVKTSTTSPGGIPQTNIISDQVTTWKSNWGSGPGKWAPYQTFRSTDTTAPPFDKWNGGMPTTGWLLTGTVMTRDMWGLPISVQDIDGVMTSTIYDRDRLKLVTTGFNANVAAAELSYFGCEPYETNNGWGWTGQGALGDHVTTAEYHTGTRSLLLPPVPASQTGPVLVMQPGSQQSSFVFSCWGIVDTGFNGADGKAQWEITVAKAGDNTVIPNAVAPIDMSEAVNAWGYFQKVIDLAAIRSAAGLPQDTQIYMTIQGSNRNGQGKNCYVDELRFSPLHGSFGASVYDPATQFPTAQIGNDGQSIRTIYDSYQRPFVSVGPLERVNSITIPSFSRSLTQDGTFKPDFPNSTLSLATGSASTYYDFHNATPGNWVLTPANQWNFADGKLSYTGTSGTALAAKATLTTIVKDNFAARVKVTRTPGTNLASVGLGNGYTYMLWVEENIRAWRLVQDTGSQTIILAENDWLGFRDDWVFTIIDNFVTCYAGGVEIFSAAITAPSVPPPNYGRVTLSLSQPGSFDDLLLLDDPQISVGFFDGIGGSTQSISIKGRSGTAYPTLTSGRFLDSLGRPSVVRDSLTAPVSVQTPPQSPRASDDDPPPPTLIQGDQDVYLTDELGAQRTIRQYLDGGTGGKEYTLYAYEPSPLGRVASVVAPRPSSANDALYTTTMFYGGTSRIDGESGTSLDDSNIFFVTRQSSIQSTNGDGTERIRIDRTTVTDIFGRTLRETIAWAKLQLGNGEFTVTDQGTSRIAEYVYDAVGNLTTVRTPNWFAPPGGSSPAPWEIVSTYTFQGLLASRSTSDAGTTRYLYDNAGRPRFSMDADGAAATPNIINYIRYDELGRETERGYIQDSRYNWGAEGAALSAKANVRAFPVVDPAMSGDPNYAQGAWGKRWSYDFNGDVDALYLIGRLWKTEINNGATPDYEKLAYDAFGNIISRTTRVNGFAGTDYPFDYAYNSQDKPIAITYPDLAATGTRLRVGYSYDQLGRMASVDRLSQPAMETDYGYYALYTYNYQGALATETLNNGTGSANAVLRSYTYDERGLLRSIDDPFLRETLGYDGGYNDLKYFDGQIASNGIIYRSSSRWTAPPSSYSYRYRYDPVGQLVNAQCSAGSGASIALDKDGLPGYDANGNIQKMARGATQRTYDYSPQGGGAPVNNRVRNVASGVNVAMNFDTGTVSGGCIGEWCWFSNNGGPSGPSITTDNPHSSPNCLAMPGGSLGHYNILAFTNYLAPLGNYALGYWSRTDPGFSTAIGTAGWYLTLYGVEGPVAEVQLSTITASSGWTQGNTTIDIAAIAAGLGLGEQLSYATLELRNYKRTAGPSAGPALYVDDITLTASGTTPDYGYDGNGATTSAMERNLFQITYGRTVKLTTSVQLGNTVGNKATYAYGANDQRTLALLRSADGSQTLGRTLQLNGGNIRPLAQQSVADGTTTSYYIYGLNGAIAMQRGTDVEYMLRDHLGSPRVAVSGTSGSALGALDYMPFGDLWRSTGAVATPYLYTGQQHDGETGLYNYGARMYDPMLARFYAADPAGQHPSPYLYAGNDPVNQVDPTGAISGLWWKIPAFLSMAGYVAIEHFSNIGVWLAVNLSSSLRAAFDKKLDKQNKKIISQREIDWVEEGVFTFLDRILPYALSRYKTEKTTPWEKGNAYAHFSWQSHVTTIFDATTAKMLGDAHEVGVAEAGPDTIADKINNALGRATTEEYMRMSYGVKTWSRTQYLLRLVAIHAKSKWFDHWRDASVPGSIKHTLYTVEPAINFFLGDFTDELFNREWEAGHLAKATTHQDYFQRLDPSRRYSSFFVPIFNLWKRYNIHPQSIFTPAEIQFYKDSGMPWLDEWDK